MKVSELIKSLDLKVLSGQSGLENEIKGAYISDLLSDVIGNATDGMIWITIQTHVNVIAVASLKELSAIILPREMMPETDTVFRSNEENIPVLGTNKSTFEIAGLLHQLLNRQ